MKKILLALMLILNVNLFAKDAPHVILETTQGDIELVLYPDVAPLAVENFVTHVKDGYYNGIAFHRIIHNFMIQGGDPTETGRGGESIWKKPFKDEFKSETFDKPGVLAMANAGPGTNGSQFFITTAKTAWLNGHHTIFGRVANQESMKTLEKLNNVATTGRRYGDRPLERQEIIKATVK
jgi:peptidylprolyl isomerase